MSFRYFTVMVRVSCKIAVVITGIIYFIYMTTVHIFPPKVVTFHSVCVMFQLVLITEEAPYAVM